MNRFSILLWLSSAWIQVIIIRQASDNVMYIVTQPANRPRAQGNRFKRHDREKRLLSIALFGSMAALILSNIFLAGYFIKKAIEIW